MKTLFYFLCLFFMVSGCCNSKNSNATNAPIIPTCIKDLIKKHQAEEKENPPIKIYSYSYQGRTVYHETAACCDMFSNLYDSKCVLLGHPDGGITGRGDGKFPNFFTVATNQKLVWEDKR